MNAPSPPPVSGRAAHFLGAKPTQSMAFPVCLHQVRRRFQLARRIFLVQSRRNQWLSRFACTKSPAGFRRRGAFSWCKAYVINGFPGLLAPRPPPVSGGGHRLVLFDTNYPNPMGYPTFCYQKAIRGCYQ